MRIGIDARFFGSIGKGLGRYTQKLVENLEKIDEDNEYYIFLRTENFSEYQPKNPRFHKVLANYRWYSIAEQLKFPRLLKSYKLDLVHFPHFNVPLFYFPKFVVTIHDLILIHFPTIKNSTLHPLFYWIKYLAYKLAIKSAVYRSNRIISVSEFTKNDLLKNYPSLPKEKILVTYEAAEEYCMMSPGKDKEILDRYGIMKPYILYVGNAYPHKNLERLVKAFQLLLKKKQDIQLVLVGNKDYFYKRLMNYVIQEKIENVLFLGYVPDYELDTLFHNTKLFVWPSLYEGFGLPPLEAMAKGTPVVSSDHPCMREILGDSVRYFKGLDIDDMAYCIYEVLNDPHQRERLIQLGYSRICQYSWKKMARSTLEIYNTILRWGK